jgi:hypothetical protein
MNWKKILKPDWRKIVINTPDLQKLKKKSLTPACKLI